jgi:hypothetical protein
VHSDGRYMTMASKLACNHYRAAMTESRGRVNCELMPSPFDVNDRKLYEHVTLDRIHDPELDAVIIIYLRLRLPSPLVFVSVN